jgi:regulation of enolase protein 1 (concanavalin A-like superfamily)
LPTGWTDADIGAVGLAGSAGYNNGTFTVSGSGADIWNTGDQFNYAYQSVSGDTTVIARVVSENGTASYAKAGVMIRESLATNSVEASVLLTPTNGVAMEIRPTTGAASINVTGWITGVIPPQWVKLVRSGNTFTASYSADGSTWTQFASTNVTMNSSAIAGLAVTSHDNTSLNTATFDNVSISAPINLSGIYQLQNEASGLVLNNQGSLTNGSAITQWSSVSSDNLRWTFIPTDSGYYQINSCKSGLDAVVQGASTANGAGIIQWSFGSAGNDQWEPVANSDGSYTFYNLHSGLVLEDPASSTNKTTQMDQWSANGGANQKWQLIKQ